MTYAIPCFLIGMLVTWLICQREFSKFWRLNQRLIRERDQFERESKALLRMYAAHLDSHVCVVKEVEEEGPEVIGQ